MAGFGPNGGAVESFLERISEIGEGDALALAATWRAGNERRRRLAWRALRRAARDADLERALEAAQSEITTWSNRSEPLVAYGGPTGGTGLMRAQVMRGAVPALADAISALVVGGHIDAEDFEALYGPFRSIDRRARSR